MMNQGKFQDLLSAQSRAELRSMIDSGREGLTLPEAHKLAAHAKTLEPIMQTLRLGIIQTYTSNLLDPWLDLSAALQGLRVEIYHAPYGLSLQEAQEGSGLVLHEPDLTLVMLRREDLHPNLAKPLVGFTRAQQRDLRNETVERICGMLGTFQASRVGQIVLTILPSMLPAALGIFDAQSDRSENTWWASLKANIGACLCESMPGCLLLDLDETLQQIGREHYFDPRLWYSAQSPFTVDAAREVARRAISLGAVIKLPKVKCIVIDADNTLWGGVIGEDGMNGIALGPDYPGNTYVAFQRRLLDYQQRGFILALCSKNNPDDVDQVLREHPHQLLRYEHFAAQRVNWLPKPENLASIAEELNLGLDSMIFVDDSDHECAMVRHQLPQVEVVRTPAKPVYVPTCLEGIARLEVLTQTPEDRAKTEMYAQERRRRELKQSLERSGDDPRSYLASLQMKMRVAFDSAAHLARLAQLTQKTNQFNLTTHRYNAQQIQDFIQSDDWLVAHFSLSDVFGDSGIVGMAILHKMAAGKAELDTFLMSCRVIGREAESAFLNAILVHLAEHGVFEVMASYLPTPKNQLVQSFLPKHGFAELAQRRYRRDLRATPPLTAAAFPVALDVEP